MTLFISFTLATYPATYYTRLSVNLETLIKLLDCVLTLYLIPWSPNLAPFIRASRYLVNPSELSAPQLTSAWNVLIKIVSAQIASHYNSLCPREPPPSLFIIFKSILGPGCVNRGKYVQGHFYKIYSTILYSR